MGECDDEADVCGGFVFFVLWGGTGGDWSTDCSNVAGEPHHAPQNDSGLIFLPTYVRISDSK